MKVYLSAYVVCADADIYVMYMYVYLSSRSNIIIYVSSTEDKELQTLPVIATTHLFCT